MYYTSATQVAALLPSNTPRTGGGPGATITVTYNGQASPSTPVAGIVSNNLGIFTVDSTGTGPAIVPYADYSLVSPGKAANCGGPNTTCGAANPGDTLILWATGLGPIAGDDASGAGLGQNMPNIPIQIRLGGVQATVVYQGRSGCCIGEDQIVFTVSDNVPTGCAVPLMAQIGGQVSNTTSIAVAKGSRSCSPADPALAALNVQQVASQPSFNLGVVELDHFLNDNGSGYFDQASFGFLKVSGIPPALAPFFAAIVDSQPLGTCTVIGSRSPSDTFFNSLNLAPIDGGSSFTITGPNGAVTVKANLGDRPQLSPAGKFLTPGDYTITGGPGKDVGAFTAHITIPAYPTLLSPASPNNLAVVKSQGMTVTWDPNGSTGHVELVVASALDQNTQAEAVCKVPASAGTFTIPPYVLLALPNNTGGSFFAFQHGDHGPAGSAAFTAPGLDAGLVQTFIDGYLGRLPDKIELAYAALAERLCSLRKNAASSVPACSNAPPRIRASAAPPLPVRQRPDAKTGGPTSIWLLVSLRPLPCRMCLRIGRRTCMVSTPPYIMSMSTQARGSTACFCCRELCRWT
jgi:uncharacterized protein (TIGR03437 family)